MADIFLSYAREDQSRAKPVVKALEAHGWIVFWDPAILPGPRFRQVLERELAASRCAVVLWSDHSVQSEWVHEEAQRAMDRGVLFQVRIDNVRPPLGFGQRQVADLVGWNGDPEAPEFEALVRAIRDLIGSHADVILWPEDFNLITGDPAKYGDLPPTVNMMCHLLNKAGQPLELERLEFSAARNGKSVYHLVWHLFYYAFKLEHVKVKADEQIRVAGQSDWCQGVQFRESRADIANVWPAGVYEFELLGWTGRRPAHTPPNIKTRFRARVDAYTEGEMTRWSRATVAEWDEKRASDRALGFPLEITDLVTGL